MSFMIPKPFPGSSTLGASPSALFAASEPGVWYDPSDVANTNWRYNLLTFTEQFDNAVWYKDAATISVNAIAAPDGTLTADKLVENTVNTTHDMYTLPATQPIATFTYSLYVKASGRTKFRLQQNSTTAYAVLFDLVSATVTTVAGGAIGVITSVGNGWYRCSITYTTTVSFAPVLTLYLANDAGTISYTGDGTSGIYIWGAQFELSSTATTYQPITTVDAGTIARFPYATLYQDSAGTTPVTAPAQPVGLMLSKDKGLVIGPELVTNGDFTSGTTGWAASFGATISSEGGRLKIVTTSVGAGATQTITAVVGKRYQVTASGFYSSSSPVRIGVGSGIGSGQEYDSGDKLQDFSFSFSFVAGRTSEVIWTYASTIGTSYYDNISVKEIAGNHATQSTSASRPTYAIVPATGRRNLLTYSEQFDNAVWSKSAVGITANSTTAPDGTLTADTCTPDTTAAAHLLFQSTTVSGSNVQSIYVKANGYTKVSLREGQTGAYFAAFDLSGAGSVLFTSSATATITAVGNGWFRIAMVGTLTGTTRIALYVLDPSYTTGSVITSWTPNGTSGIFVWGAQVENGSTATAYQKVVTAFEVTEANVASLSYISFDGVDDFMVTPTITPGTDKVQVFAGVRKLTSTLGVIAETSTAVGGNSGSFYLVSGSNPSDGFTFASRGAGPAGEASAVTAAAITAVTTGTGDISGDRSTFRLNGTQSPQSTTDQGTGNYLAYPMYIGRRAGTSLPFNGNLFGLVTRFGANLDTGRIASIETFMAQKTGVTL